MFTISQADVGAFLFRPAAAKQSISAASLPSKNLTLLSAFRPQAILEFDEMSRLSVRLRPTCSLCASALHASISHDQRDHVFRLSSQPEY